MCTIIFIDYCSMTVCKQRFEKWICALYKFPLLSLLLLLLLLLLMDISKGVLKNDVADTLSCLNSSLLQEKLENF